MVRGIPVRVAAIRCDLSRAGRALTIRTPLIGGVTVRPPPGRIPVQIGALVPQRRIAVRVRPARVLTTRIAGRVMGRVTVRVRPTRVLTTRIAGRVTGRITIRVRPTRVLTTRIARRVVGHPVGPFGVDIPQVAAQVRVSVLVDLLLLRPDILGTRLLGEPAPVRAVLCHLCVPPLFGLATYVVTTRRSIHGWRAVRSAIRSAVRNAGGRVRRGPCLNRLRVAVGGVGRVLPRRDGRVGDGRRIGLQVAGPLLLEGEIALDLLAVDGVGELLGIGHRGVGRVLHTTRIRHPVGVGGGDHPLGITELGLRADPVVRRSHCDRGGPGGFGEPLRFGLSLVTLRRLGLPDLPRSTAASVLHQLASAIVLCGVVDFGLCVDLLVEVLIRRLVELIVTVQDLVELIGGDQVRLQLLDVLVLALVGDLALVVVALLDHVVERFFNLIVEEPLIDLVIQVIPSPTIGQIVQLLADPVVLVTPVHAHAFTTRASSRTAEPAPVRRTPLQLSSCPPIRR